MKNYEKIKTNNNNKNNTKKHTLNFNAKENAK